MIIKKDMIVKYASGWCTESEKRLMFIVLESYEDKKRAKIGALNSSCAFGLIETVDWEMIEEV